MCGHVDFVSSIDTQMHLFIVTAIRIDGTTTYPSQQVSVQPQLSSMLFQKLSQAVSDLNTNTQIHKYSFGQSPSGRFIEEKYASDMARYSAYLVHPKLFK